MKVIIPKFRQRNKLHPKRKHLQNLHKKLHRKVLRNLLQNKRHLLNRLQNLKKKRGKPANLDSLIRVKSEKVMLPTGVQDLPLKE